MKFGETQLASGTAFLVQSQTGMALITARHNLTGRHQETNDCLHRHGGVPDSIEIFHNALRPGAQELRAEPILDQEGRPLWMEHPKLEALCDVVLLPLVNASGVLFAPYTWQGKYADIAIQVAETVSVIGFPMAQSAGAMLGIWCTGYIASEPSQDYAGQPKFLIDCRTRQGQSGSPVIAYRYGSFTSAGGGLIVTGGGANLRPLGVYTGRIHPEADVGVVWKWSVVEDLMREFDSRNARRMFDLAVRTQNPFAPAS